MFKIIRFVEKHISVFVLVTFFLGMSVVSAVSPDAPMIERASVVIDGEKKTLIVEGVAAQETEVLIYVNDKYFGTTDVLNEKFVFSEVITLSQGVFSVVVAARNPATQEISSLSSIVRPTETVKIKIPVKNSVQKLKKPKKPEEVKEARDAENEIEQAAAVNGPQNGVISFEAVQEEQPVVKGHEDKYLEKELEETKKEKESLDNLKKILSNNEEKTSTSSTGIINEAREELGKIKLNVFIFLVFLVAVIAWIVWVNRELIKEKQEEKN